MARLALRLLLLAKNYFTGRISFKNKQRSPKVTETPIGADNDSNGIAI